MSQPSDAVSQTKDARGQSNRSSGCTDEPGGQEKESLGRLDEPGRQTKESRRRLDESGGELNESGGQRPTLVAKWETLAADRMALAPD